MPSGEGGMVSVWQDADFHCRCAPSAPHCPTEAGSTHICSHQEGPKVQHAPLAQGDLAAAGKKKPIWGAGLDSDRGMCSQINT